MTARNPITGDLIQTKGPSKLYEQNYPFETTAPKRGRYRQDKQTGKFIPIDEWYEKYGEAPKPQSPMVIIKNFKPGISPVTGKVLHNERQMKYDLESSGCREYEGRENEQKEVDRYLKHQDEKLERCLEETIGKTAHDIEHGYHTPTGEDKVSFTFGE